MNFEIVFLHKTKTFMHTEIKNNSEPLGSIVLLCEGIMLPKCSTLVDEVPKCSPLVDEVPMCSTLVDEVPMCSTLVDEVAISAALWVIRCLSAAH